MVARESGWLDELRSRSGLPSNKQATARQLPETKVGGGAPGALPLSSWIVAAAEANTKQTLNTDKSLSTVFLVHSHL